MSVNRTNEPTAEQVVFDTLASVETGMGVQQVCDALRAHGLLSEGAPDAVTEQARADSEWRDGTIIAQLAKAEAERDAALAAVERVRAIAERHGVKSWTEEVFAALDGAPEPEEKP